MAEVSLREVTKDNVTPLCKIEVAENQERFVAHNAVTIAQAHYENHALLRAIYAGDEPVGLAAMAFEDAEWWLWRLMVDKNHQRRGYGGAALAQVIELIRAEGANELFTSYVPGDGDPRGFYLKAGFEETDRVEEGERVLRLPLG